MAGGVCSISKTAKIRRKIVLLGNVSKFIYVVIMTIELLLALRLLIGPI